MNENEKVTIHNTSIVHSENSGNFYSTINGTNMSTCGSSESTYKVGSVRLEDKYSRPEIHETFTIGQSIVPGTFLLVEERKGSNGCYPLPFSL